MEAYQLISEVAFPITAALGIAGAFWFILRWLMHNITGEIKEVQEKLTNTQQEEMAILVKLIDRVRSLEDGVTRTEIIIRTAYDLGQEWNKIGKAQDFNDKHKG